MRGETLVVLTGMSGAGKNLASCWFEDQGWRVLDNLPPRLIAKVADDLRGEPQPLCFIADVRGGEAAKLPDAVRHLRDAGESPILLFLDASDETLIQRFKETRRPHPLFENCGGILPAIAAERDLLAPLRAAADILLDSSGLTPGDLRAALSERFAGGQPQTSPLTVTVASFGFKHGVPLDADLVFDVRFLRNPHYVEELRPHDGRDQAVEAFVMADERASCLLERLYDLVGWSLPQYVAEGKSYLTIAVGCTGGRHRSIVIAEKLAAFVRECGFPVLVQHRHVGRGTHLEPGDM